MATLYQVPNQNNQQYTLNSQLAQGGGTLTLNTDVSAIVNAPGVCVIDRVDSSGNKTPSVREYVSFTGVSTTQLTGLTRGLAGSTNQVHNVGAIVEFVPDVVQEQAWYSVFTTEHGVTGQHISLPSLQLVRTTGLISSSLASLQQEFVANLLNASGASLQGFPQTPVWVFPGTPSGATTALGRPIDMNMPGKIQWMTAITRAGSSNASLFLDITKNNSSVIAATASTSLFQIPINGTFVSTASITTPNFVAGDVFNFSVLNNGSMAQDLTVKFFAR